eukprot:TRINITY_DN2990_c0_g1_i1.p1 TRINITY_DN2990_c0_g1~~TRINITY_DN2990_c0_g1_i1.p1  ORF type:complete len:135 (-),score=26.75 TRINITY_DN2990_c0_g1_i1:267-671(-)
MATRLHIAPTRVVLDMLRTQGALSREQIWNNSPLDIMSSRTHLKKVLQMMQRENRVKAYLPIGKVQGVDNYVYKINPMAERVNFPRTYRHKGKTATAKERELRRVLHIKTVEEIYPVIAADTAIEEDELFDPTL